MTPKYTIGLDYGTNSVRALIVDTANGREVGTAVWDYEPGTSGHDLVPRSDLARQHPARLWESVAEVTIKEALASAKKSVKNFRVDQIRRHRRGHDR